MFVHRIKEVVISKDENFYITQGDANEADDGIILDEKMILGAVNKKVSYLGLPTVWVHDFMNQGGD